MKKADEKQMWNPQIDVDRDKVTIDNTIVKRPKNIAPSEWYLYWEEHQHFKSLWKDTTCVVPD